MKDSIMRIDVVVLVLSCCLGSIGCDTAKVDELTKQVDKLRAENERLQRELTLVQQKQSQADEIRKGYEDARKKFQEQLAGLNAVLGGGAVNPLPPFEGLKNSDWVGKLLPGAAADLGNLKNLKEVENELLKGILGEQQKKK